MKCKSCGTDVGILSQINGYCAECHLDQLAIRSGAKPRYEREVDVQVKAERDYNVENLTVTTETAHNLPIDERFGIVAGESVLGLNFFKDLFADVRGVVGGRSATMQKAMKDAR